MLEMSLHSLENLSKLGLVGADAGPGEPVVDCRGRHNTLVVYDTYDNQHEFGAYDELTFCFVARELPDNISLGLAQVYIAPPVHLNESLQEGQVRPGSCCINAH